VQPYAAQGQPGAWPTPLSTGISPTLQSELPKLNPEIEAKVQGRLDQQQRALTPDEIAKLSPADRLDYSPRFDQSKMPPNRYDGPRPRR
jgi:hypothetical protein